MDLVVSAHSTVLLQALRMTNNNMLSLKLRSCLYTIPQHFASLHKSFCNFSVASSIACCDKIRNATTFKKCAFLSTVEQLLSHTHHLLQTNTHDSCFSVAAVPAACHKRLILNIAFTQCYKVYDKRLINGITHLPQPITNASTNSNNILRNNVNAIECNSPVETHLEGTTQFNCTSVIADSHTEKRRM